MGQIEKQPHSDVQDQDTIKTLIGQSILLNLVIPEASSHSEEDPSVNALEDNQVNQSNNECLLTDPYFEMSLPFDTLPNHKLLSKRDKQTCVNTLAIESKKRKVVEPLNNKRKVKNHNEESKYKFHAFDSDVKKLGLKKSIKAVIRKIKQKNETTQLTHKKLKDDDLFKMSFQSKDNTQLAKQFTMNTKDKKIWQSDFSMKSQMK